MATTAQSGPVLRFDIFEVDFRSGEIRKHGARTRLQDQPFQVLRLLLERTGEVVTREELKQKLWPADTFVDFDDGLNTAVKKLRDTLGDSAESPRYIETLPRRGYRFIGTLQPQEQVAERPAVAKPSLQKRDTRLRWIAIGLAVAFVPVAASILIERARLRSEAASVRSIAVLPLQNLSDDPGQDYFAAGMTDALTTELARTVGSSLEVRSRTSATKFKDKPLSQIARELNVDAVIEGSVVRSGNRVRIIAQLIQAREDKHLWADSYDRDLGDMLVLEREIAVTVARQVQIKLSPQIQARLAAARRVDPQAYDLYQRGRYRAFSNNRQDLMAAIGFLEKAVQLDPNLAVAHAVLARAYIDEAFMLEPQEEDLERKATDEVNQALKLEPDLAEAYLVRGLVYWTHRNGFPHERAIIEIKRALQLDPNLAEAHHWLGAIYAHVGLFDKAEYELRAALQLDPTNVGVRYRIAINLFDKGRLEEAISGLEGTKAYSPNLWHSHMAEALLQVGRKQEAAVLIRDYLRDNPRDEGGVGNATQALLYADAGRPPLAERSIQAAIQQGKDFGHFHHAAYTIASTYAVMNRPKDAVRWLRAAAEDGFPCYPLFEHDSNLDHLRHDPGFLGFLAEQRKQWDYFREHL